MAPEKVELTVAELATHYIDRGWSVIPVPLGQKAPTMAGWPNLRISLEEVPTYFSGRLNVGLLLGEPSRGLVDIDLLTFRDPHDGLLPC